MEIKAIVSLLKMMRELNCKNIMAACGEALIPG